jgi:hypothetical protein
VPVRARVLSPRTSRGHSDVAVACALATFAMRGSGNAALAMSSGFEPSESGFEDIYMGSSSGITPDMDF